jgi:hypothetical protein
MPKRDWYSFSDRSPDGPCTFANSEHVLRQAPRSTPSFSGAGNVVPMNRRKGVPADTGASGKADALSQSERQRMTEQIGRQLRGMYDGLLNQPVPDRLADLVKRLESDDHKGGRDK